MSIKANCEAVEAQIQAALSKTGRSREDLTVIAVTKTKPVELVRELYQLGYRHFAENRVEGLLEKQEALKDREIKWHFIGSLQTRKVKEVINRVDYFHALDRLSLAQEIEKRADHTISCFVQVNVTGETSKHGVSPDDVCAFVRQLAAYPHIKVVGLMTMAPAGAPEEQLHQCFATLKELQETVAALDLSFAPCVYTSMGMSQDYTAAILEGASFVRIGSAFFR